MPTNPKALADEIHKVLAAPDEKVSKESEGLAKAILDTLKKAVVLFPVGTIQGLCPPGGPLSNGNGQGGKLTGLVPKSLALSMQISMGLPNVTPQLEQWSAGFVSYFLQANLTFDPNTVTGSCANSASSPGPFTGAGGNGKVVPLPDSSLASLLSFGPPSTEVKNLAKAIRSYIAKNATINIPAPNVSGVCPPGGGPLTAGTAVAGRFL